MADVSHELGALRFVVESPLSSKVAMFNNAVSKHQESQHLNPFSQTGGLPKPTFNKGEYGKPLAGSLTEARGQKANIHVLKEMLELCQIIDSEGYNVKDEPNMKVIPFGELFNIYTYVSDKVVGILLRARKHKLIEFEGEVLFQRRDDDVPVFLLKPIKEIRQILEQKQDEIRRSVSPAPQATTVMMDNHMRAPSASPTPSKPKAKIVKPVARKAEVATEQPTPEIKVEQPPKEVTTESAAKAKQPAQAPAQIPPVTVPAKPEPAQVAAKDVPPSAGAQAVKVSAAAPESVATPPATTVTPPTPTAATEQAVKVSETPAAAPKSVPTPLETTVTPPTPTAATEQAVKVSEKPVPVASLPETTVTPPTPTSESAPAVVLTPAAGATSPEEKTDINNNEEAPAIVATTQALSNAEAPLPAQAEAVPTVATVPNVA